MPPKESLLMSKKIFSNVLFLFLCQWHSSIIMEGS
jgi:hypothetical protein